MPVIFALKYQICKTTVANHRSKNNPLRRKSPVRIRDRTHICIATHPLHLYL